MLGSRQQTVAVIAVFAPLLEAERSLLGERVVQAGQRDMMALIGWMLYGLRRQVCRTATSLAGTDAALRVSEQRFQQIFEHSPLGIVLARR